jgi:annexin A7/11
LKGVLALLKPTDEYEAECVRKAISGAGTDERACIQLICPKEAHEIEILKAAYNRLYNRDLDKDFSNEEGGHLGRIFRSIVQGGRPDSGYVDHELAKKEAQELYQV